jgi:hypothetical protein
MNDLTERVAAAILAGQKRYRAKAARAIRELLAAQHEFLDRQPRGRDEDVQMLICASALLLMFAREHGIEPTEGGTEP